SRRNSNITRKAIEARPKRKLHRSRSRGLSRILKTLKADFRSHCRSNRKIEIIISIDDSRAPPRCAVPVIRTASIQARPAAYTRDSDVVINNLSSGIGILRTGTSSSNRVRPDRLSLHLKSYKQNPQDKYALHNTSFSSHQIIPASNLHRNRHRNYECMKGESKKLKV